MQLRLIILNNLLQHIVSTRRGGTPRRALLYTLLALISTNLWSQSEPWVCTGYLYSQEAREPVVGAQVISLTSRQATTTDIDGYFQLSLTESVKDVKLVVQAFGFTADTLQLLQATNNRIFLKPYTIDAVEVKATALVATRMPGSITPALSELRNLPLLFGEPDILKSLTIYPGISGGIEGTSGLHVRGGSPDQNLMLLDDVTVYNSGHVFGFLSVFNSDVLNSVTLHRDFIPARHSSRLSSVVDVSTRDGRADERSTKLSLGLINSNLTSQGPLGGADGKTTYTVGARLAPSAVPSLAVSTLSAGGTSLFAGMYDVNGKVTRRWSSGAKLSLGIYAGDDFIINSQSDGGSSSSFALRYGNRNVFVRGVSPLGSRWFLRGSASLAGYQSKLNTSTKLNGVVNLGASTRSFLNEFKFRQELSTALPKGTFAVGVAGSNTKILPLSIDFPDAEHANRPNFSNFLTRRGEVFADLSHELIAKLTGFAGINVNAFGVRGEDTSPLYLEPRIGLTYSPLQTLAISGSVTRLFQPLHYTTAVAPGFIYDVWIPASNARPASSSNNFSVGLDWKLKSKDRVIRELALGGFYRRLEGLVTTRNAGLNPIGFSGEDQFFTELLSGGSGRAYGLEGKWDYQEDRNTWTVAYTYSRSFRSFPEISRGEEYRYRFDRPHDLTVNYQRKLNDRWSVSGTFVWQSGVLATVPTEYILDVTGRLSPVFNKRNNLRLPHYHRLDLMFSKAIQTRRLREARLDLGLYNVYARRNTSLITTRKDFISERFDSPNIGQQLFFLRGAVFQIIPTVNYTITW